MCRHKRTSPFLKNRIDWGASTLKQQLQTLCDKVEQSSSLYYNQLCGMWYLSIHTHRALLWKHCCKYLPPCLLCCYSSHPRIVSFFLCPSLVFVTHNLQWKPQFSLSLIPLFSLAFFSVPKEQLASLNHQCVSVRVWVREHALWGIPKTLPMTCYYGDGKYQAGWPVCVAR